MIIDLRTLPCVLLTIERNTERHERMREWLSRYGFNNVRWIYGRPTEDHHRGAREMATQVLEETTAPFLWIEDDATPTRLFHPVVEIPDESQIFYLGGCISGRSKMLGRSFPKAKRSILSKSKHPQALYHDTDDPRFIRIISMYSGHAIIWIKEWARKQMFHALKTIMLPHTYDMMFGTWQHRFRVYGLRHPYFYQRDGINDEYTIRYCEGPEVSERAAAILRRIPSGTEVS